MRLGFLIYFMVVGFLTKIVGEAIHEIVGHGSLVLVFGGTIRELRLSLLWPYDLSYIGFNPPAEGFLSWQRVWIDAGGILACLAVSLAVQAILLVGLLREAGWPITVAVFWLGFWTFINPTGYLIIGGLAPFGDVANLISAGILTQGSSLAIGLAVFLLSFFSLTKILKDILFRSRLAKVLPWSLAVFWIIIPLITVLTVVGRRQQLVLVLPGLIPVVVAATGVFLNWFVFSAEETPEP
jgi:hypothetical protein